jgi:hypothetical protein
MYGSTKLEARQQHKCRQQHKWISGWMQGRDLIDVNNEKTMFMTRGNTDWAIHGLFVNDMTHTSTSFA